MTPTFSPKMAANHPFSAYIDRLLAGGTLLPDSADNLLEVVGSLDSYGVVLDAYSINLNFIAEHQFLVLFPFFKYFDGEISLGKILRFLWHDRINFEYAEYTMRTMLWHGGGGLDTYLDSPEFKASCEAAIQAQLKHNPAMRLLHRIFPEFLPEQVRQSAYYSGLGQFWRVMSDLFIALAKAYDQGEVTSIPEVVTFIKAGLVAAANRPIVYAVQVGTATYEIIPESAGLTFLRDTAVPYVEAIFLRGSPFLGTVSYNAQAQFISPDQSRFTYGALFADWLPIGSAGIPPTLLMQDMYRHLPDYLYQYYLQRTRGEWDIKVKICMSFQRAMFCVTNAAILGLMPYAADTQDSQEQLANRQYLAAWMDRLTESCLDVVQTASQA